MDASSILLYLLKANAALLLFAVAYFGLLRRLTFFTLNRVYLVLALLFAAVYPALPVPALLPAEAAPAVVFAVVETTGPAAAQAAPLGPAVDWAAVGVALYAAGTAVFLLRLLVQLLSLGQLRARARPALVQGQPVRVLAGEVSPFSFWQTIYLNPGQHPGSELTAVLRHEQVHVRQWHTLDVLLAQLAQAAAWCNPAAWLLRRALLDNLEYLADHAALETGLDRHAYQCSLLRLSHGVAGPSLVSHFTFPTLKNRVLMMNSPLSSSGQLARYIVAGPLMLAVALGFSAARAQGAGPAVPVARTASAQQDDRPEPTTHYIDGKVSTVAEVLKVGPENTAFMTALKGEEARKLSGNPADEYVVVITTKQHQNRADVRAFNQKVAAAEARENSLLTTTPNRQRVTTTSPKATYPKPQRQAGAEARSTPAPGALTAPKVRVPLDAPRPAGPPPLYYVDGKVQSDALKTLNPDDIASVNVFKGEKARQLAGDAGTTGIVVITTKPNQDTPEVRAFNEKMGIAPAPPKPAATGVPYLAAPALAYITKHYPGARLLGVTEVKATDGSPSRYQAEVAIGRRPGYLLFDGQGQFISESYTSYLK
jgi:hypothetical protein